MCIFNYVRSPNYNPSLFSKKFTGSSLLSDDIFNQVDELFEGSDEDKLKAYELLKNLNEEVST